MADAELIMNPFNVAFGPIHVKPAEKIIATIKEQDKNLNIKI
jgi:hypothetical protein